MPKLSYISFQPCLKFANRQTSFAPECFWHAPHQLRLCSRDPQARHTAHSLEIECCKRRLCQLSNQKGQTSRQAPHKMSWRALLSCHPGQTTNQAVWTTPAHCFVCCLPTPAVKAWHSRRKARPENLQLHQSYESKRPCTTQEAVYTANRTKWQHQRLKETHLLRSWTIDGNETKLPPSFRESNLTTCTAPIKRSNDKRGVLSCSIATRNHRAKIALMTSVVCKVGLSTVETQELTLEAE